MAILKPDKYKKYSSFIYPYLYRTDDKKNFIFIEAQKKNGSDILCFKPDSFLNWRLYPKFKLVHKKISFNRHLLFQSVN